jgi:hypothetical protein
MAKVRVETGKRDVSGTQLGALGRAAIGCTNRRVSIQVQPVSFDRALLPPPLARADYPGAVQQRQR